MPGKLYAGNILICLSVDEETHNNDIKTHNNNRETCDNDK